MPRSKGQITRLKNGVWQMRVQQCIKGVRKSVSKRYATRKDAEDALETLFDDLAKESETPENHTCKDLFDAYINVRKPDLRVQTVEFYERKIKTHLSQFDKLPLTDLTPLVLDNFFSSQKQKYAPSTVIKLHHLVKAILNKALHWKWITEHPMSNIKPPKNPKIAKEALTPEEIAAFFSAAGKHETQWIFAATTGCRAGEIFGAKWKDIDFEKRIFTVTQVLVFLKNKTWIFGYPKTEKSARQIPLSKEVIARLKKHKVEQNKRRLLLGDLWHDHDLVFPNGRGNPQRIPNISEKVKKIASDAGITKKVWTHLLRHSFITNAIDNGSDIKEVSEMVGHSTVEITLNIYKQTKFSNKESIAEGMSDLLLRRVRKNGRNIEKNGKKSESK